MGDRVPNKTIPVKELRERMRALESCPAWSNHSRQNAALDEAVRTRSTVFICDRPSPVSRGSKMYYAGGLYQFWKTLCASPLPRRNFYEMLYVDQPAHFYIDFEYYPQFNPGQDAEFPFEERRRVTLELVFEELARVCPNATCVDVVEIDSSKEGKKFSRHFVFHVHGHMFKDIRHCGAFQRHLQQRATATYGAIHNNPYFAWSNDPGDPNCADGVREVRRPVVDHGVYTRHRPMRLPWCTKMGEYRPLIPITRWTVQRLVSDDGELGTWRNVCGDVEEYTTQLPVASGRAPNMSYDMLTTCMILFTTDEFLATCTSLDDDPHMTPVVRLIEMREPDGREPQSSSLLLSHQRQRVMLGDAMRVPEPDLIADGALAGYRPSDATRADQTAAEEAMSGRDHPGCIDGRYAERLLQRPVVLYDSMRRTAADAGDDIARNVENACLADMIAGMEGMNAAEHRENATQLCTELGNALCANRGFRDNGRSDRPEFVAYRWILESAMMFGYQILTGNCSVCNKTHKSNNLKMLVMLEPPQWFQDPEYPDAPVVYYKCFKTGHRSRPHAIYFYVTNDMAVEDVVPAGASSSASMTMSDAPSLQTSRNLRERLDAYIEHSRRMFRHAPRSIFAPLLRAPVTDDQVVIDLSEDE